MGCDIHAHLEIMVNGVWEYHAPVEMYRQYPVFAYMADVRSCNYNIKPIDVPRGLPSDISTPLELIYRWEHPDLHSESWLSHDEMKELQAWYISARLSSWPLFNAALFGNFITDWKQGAADYPDFIQDIRLVFWFDS